jgi:hypothetical protein
MHKVNIAVKTLKKKESTRTVLWNHFAKLSNYLKYKDVILLRKTNTWYH